MIANILFTNQFSLGNDGWAQLAPFGDFPGQALVRQEDGSTQKVPAIQRIDREGADKMVARFHSPLSRIARYFTGCPIYVGHPDVEGFSDGKAQGRRDTESKGMIVDLAVRADGLYCKPVFTNEGMTLVESRAYRAFSGHWSACEIARNGASTKRIFRPDALKSAGLTNHPNLPVHLLNERDSNHNQNSSTTEIVNKQIIIQFLASQGITIANEASDHDIHSALEQIGMRIVNAETTLATRAMELETLQTHLANERGFHAETLLERAVAEGSITAAQRAGWASRLAADFANACAALAELPRAVKTRSMTLTHGGRKTEIAGSVSRRQTLDALVRAEMTSNGGDYDKAFAAVQRANPALFDAMQTPA